MEGSGVVLEALVPPGETAVTFQPQKPIQVQPGQPISLVVEALPDVAWRLSPQEPPGTQAARWDPDLGYWRWLHGTLMCRVSPASRPYSPANVLSGVTRPEIGANLWISDPNQPLPQTVTLRWREPVRVARVELTFDSQLSGWIWEGAFPFIPRDYNVEWLPPGEETWEVWAEVQGNFQRHRVHVGVARFVQALRVVVAATHGGTTARIVEVRVYA